MSLPPVPHDGRLPQLATALDPSAMAVQFGSLLHAHGTEVERCDIERVRYRPWRDCRVGYRLQLRRRWGGDPFEQRVTASVGGDLAVRTRESSAFALTPSATGPALRVLPALQMLTLWWPNDASLRAPAVLADAARLRREVLPPVLAALGGGALAGHAVEVTHYVPGQRLSVRATLRWHDGGVAHELQACGKASRDPDGATAHAQLVALQTSPAARDGALRCAEPLLWQPEAGLRWQRTLPGTPWLALAPQHQQRLSGALGTCFAALHATPVPQARAITATGLQDQLAAAVAVLSAALPAARRDLRRAARALAAGLPRVAAAAPATLHGHLHPANLVVDAQDRIGLADLDGLQRGPAALELGAWIADGACRALRSPAGGVVAGGSSLLDGYRRGGGSPLTPADLAWSTAWSLLTQQALRCVVNLRPGRLALAPELIARAAALAERGDLERAFAA